VIFPFWFSIEQPAGHIGMGLMKQQQGRICKVGQRLSEEKSFFRGRPSL
jgi:hypothetical protein